MCGHMLSEGQLASVKTRCKIIVLAIAAALVFWLADAVIVSKLAAGTSFWKALITDISADVFFRRLVVTACIAFFGIPLATAIALKRRLRTALDESEKRTRHLFAEAPLPYQSLDGNGRIVDVNRVWLSALGYSAAEVVGRNFGDFLSPSSAEKFAAAFQNFLADGHVSGIEFDLICKDGSIITASFSGRVVRKESSHFLSTQCFFADITARRLSEKALQASEEKYRLLVENANEAVFVAQNGIVKLCNERMSEMLGYTTARITSEPFADYIHADDREGALKRHHRRLAGEALPSNDLRVIGADGSVKWLEINGVLIEWEGKPAILNFANDITERKRAEEALRLANLVVESSPVVLFRWKTTEGWPVDMVSQNVGQFGYTPEELLSGAVPFALMVYSEDLDRVAREVREYVASGTDQFQQEYRIVTKDGRVRWVDDHTLVERNTEGQIVFFQGVVIDITERKEIELKLSEQSEKFRGIFDESVAAIYIFDQEKNFLDSNQAGLDLLGYSREELLGLSIPDVDADPVVVLPAHQKLLAGDRIINYEHRLIRKDGSVITVLNNSRPLTDSRGAVVGMQSTLVDITERKRAEFTIAEERRRLSDIIKGTNVGTWEYTVATGETVISDRWAEMLGYTREELAPITMERWNEMTHPEDRQVFNEILRQHFEGERDYYECEVRMRHKNGNWVWVLDRGRVHTWSDDRKPLLMSGTHQDITERKRTELTLAGERRRLADIIGGTNVGTWEFDVNTGISVMSDRWAGILGYTREELSPVTIQKWNDLVHPDDLQGSNEALRQHFEGERDYYECELRMRHKNGSWVWILDRGRVHTWSDDGKPLLMSGTHQDITERKRAEEALRESELRFRTVFENAADANLLLIDGVHMDCNQAALSMLDCSREEIIGHGPLKFSPEFQPDGMRSADKAAAFIREAMEEGSNRFEWVHRRLNGTEFWVEIAATSLMVHGRRALLGTWRDITERKRAEEALRESKERYKRLLESVTDYIYAVKVADGKPVSTSHGEGCLAVTGYTSKEFEENPYLWFQMIVEEDRPAVQEHVSSVMTGATIPPLEHRIIHRNGSIRWVRNTLSVHADDSGSIVSYEGLISDITEQRGAKDELALSETKYRTLFESAQDAIFLMKNYLFVDCNSTTCEMFGCTREQILGKPPDQFSPEVQPDGNRSRDKALEKMNEAMAGRPQFFEWTHAKLEGTCFDAEVKLSGIEIAGERHILAIVRDITDRKRSQKALERSLSLQRATLESTADGILVVDRAGNVSSFNRKFLEMWHIPEFFTVLMDDEKLLKYVIDQVKDPARLQERLKQVYALPESQSYDTIEFKDGRVFERYSQPQRVGDEVVGRVWSFRDLTERKRVEMELARLATATEQAAEAIVMIDLEGQIEYVNPAFERITGYRRDEAIGKKWNELISKEYDESFYDELWRVLREGQVWTGRMRSCRKDESVYEEECSISPIRDQNGVIVSYVAVKRDVTQEAELENRLRQSQKLEAVGLLAAGIAHDFNNLLAGIKGFAELLTLDEEAGPKVSDYAQEILKAASRAADLTGQLLAFARKGRFLSILVNVNEVIDEVVAILERSIDRRIEIKQNYHTERPFISGDPSQIQSAILNLAINARDAMPEGGRLTFQTENVHLDETYCQLHSLDLGAGDYLAVSLTDTGIGMDEAVMAHIFDPFFTTKAQGQGTGLGLSGVYGCLRNHHGSVEVTSQLGGGSTFRLLFPVTAEQQKQAVPSERRLQLTGEERLLLVEDEEVVRNLAIKILTNAGYRVTACADGPEAVALYRDGASEFDLILLDMMMPNMHGKDVFAAMKQINPHVCVLLMSGYSDSNVQEVLDQGIKGFIPKPFRSKQLLQKIREALDTTTSPVERQSQPQ
jgi:two-component system, cell cycle sensor histidine kinase and response regulator CckA